VTFFTINYRKEGKTKKKGLEIYMVFASDIFIVEKHHK